MDLNLEWLISLFLIGLLLRQGSAQSRDCRNAPTPAARIVCEQLKKMDTIARQASSHKATVHLPPGPHGGSWAPDLAPLATTLRACTDMACVCQMIAGTRTTPCTYQGKYMQKLTRKEYRMMTDFERQRFHGALNQLKQSGTFNEIARLHSQMSQSGGAHSGPAFLPWHREFIKEVELELRRIDPEIYLPYWDSALESRLPRPADSSLFTPELMGTGRGAVTDGPFSTWRTIENTQLRRNVGGAGNPFTDADINYVLQQPTINNVLAFSAAQEQCPFRADYNCLEYTHGNVHLWVGGDMFDQSTSANDPIFYLHHSFVDYIWEQWRTSRQSRAQRETDFPSDNLLCSSAQHFGAARMAPFNQYRNIDGLSNKYTDELYQFAQRPTCTSVNPGCGSRFLFCDVSHGAPRCAAKIRVGGSCTGFVRGEDSCYNGVCVQGVCRPGSVRTTTVAPIITVRPPQNLPVPVVACWNENQCCQSWAGQGECTRNRGYMQDFCKASCNICRPNPPIRDDCSDRHGTCRSWASQGECTANPDWMTENCRRSCNRCQRTRAQTCAVGRQVATTQAPRKRCASTGCFNEYACCLHWASLGQCRSNAEFMMCNCRVSCSMCFPSDYPYGACVDYHSDCAAWSRRGECRKNPWMEENCRASCNTCFARWELQSLCGTTSNAGLIAGRRNGSRSRVAPRRQPTGAVRTAPRSLIASNRQQQPTKQAPRSGWGAQGSSWDDPWSDSFDNWNVGGAGWGWGGWGRRRRDVRNSTQES